MDDTRLLIDPDPGDQRVLDSEGIGKSLLSSPICKSSHSGNHSYFAY